MDQLSKRSGLRRLETLREDVRFAFRILHQRPGVSVVAVLTLALAIGADTAMFSVVNAIMLRPLPIREPERVVVLHQVLPKLHLPSAGVSPVQFREYSAHADVFESTALLIGRNLNLTTADQPRRLAAMRATASVFPLLGVSPLLGRTFTAQEEGFGAGHVAVLSESLWREAYGGSPDAIGKTVRLDGESAEIIGVVPAALETLYPAVQLWIPLAVPPRYFTDEERWTVTFTMLGRLRPGVTIERASAAVAVDVANVVAGAPPEHAGKLAGFRIAIASLPSEYVGDVRRPLLLLLGAVVLVLSIACANVANLLIARGVERSHEIGVRVALGASRARVVRQLLTEALFLSLVAGALGTLLAWMGTRVLVSLAPTSLPHAASIRIDPIVLAFTFGISLLAGTVFGLVPALQARKIDVVEAIQHEGRAERAPTSRRGLRQVLLVGEVALTVVLVVGSGLLLRSILKLLDVNVGFGADNVLTMRLAPSSRPAANDFSVPAQTMLARITALPGVEHAAFVSEPPFMDTANSILTLRDYAPERNAPQPHADVAMTTPDYFATLRIPLLRGRIYTDTDMANQNPVAVVDEAFARRFWPGEDAIGKQLKRSARYPWSTVIGVVGTVRPRSVRDEPTGSAYFSLYAPSMSLVVRTTTDPTQIVGSIREQVLAVDRGLAIYDVRTMQDRIAESIGQQRFVAAVLAAFAVLALVFAAVGVYSVTSNIVALRTREIGVRMALGARPANVMRLVVGEGLLVAVAGLVLGEGAAFALSRVVSSLLFGIRAADPITFAGAAGVVCGVFALASYLPARRATSVDPVAALRS